MPMEVSNANRSSSRRIKEPTLSYFLYVWRMTDVESKSIRHVSTKVELSSSARYILPIVCNSRTFSGNRDCLKRYSKGFVVITDDDVAGVLDTETSRLEHIELPKTGNGIVSASCHENGLTLAYTESQGKKSANDLYVSRMSFGQYPSLLEPRTWKLDIEDGATLLHVTCSKEKVVVVLSNGTILVYDIPENSNSDTLSPLFSRRLRMDSVSGQKKGKKRGAAGASGLDGELRVFIDSFSRAFICRHDDKSLLKIVTIDLLYGGILWVGCIERNGPNELVTQVCSDWYMCHDARFLRSASEIRISHCYMEDTLSHCRAIA